jgi:hypothetical protein
MFRQLSIENDNILKKIIILLSLLAFFACEDNKDDDSSLIGTWELSNMGEFANGDCTGEVDNTGWALVQAFGMKVTMIIKSDGTGTYSATIGTETQDVSLTWDENKICMMGECINYKVSGDSFSLDQQTEAYCEDDYGDETNHSTKAACESAGNGWFEASCTKMTFTKE